MKPRAFLKYPGGKGKLLSQYAPFFPERFNTYYEAFLGGGSMFFHLQPKTAILNDISPELINTYIQVRDRVEELIVLLQEHKQQHSKEYYYSLREQHPEEESQLSILATTRRLSDLEQAARFIYLNKTCFNGLARTNARGRFNTPIGKYDDPPICQADLLRSASQALQGVEISNLSFDAVLGNVQQGDFVFLDPPYVPLSGTSSFTAYSATKFTLTDHVKLRDWFVELVDRGAYVLLSNSSCPLVHSLYEGYPIRSISAQRSINSNTKKRGTIAEVLVQGVPK